MLAWEEEQHGVESACQSPGDSDHDGGRGDHTDGLIGKLIVACQMNDISKAFALYEKLRRMRVPLYEGVYKMIIECCMRTQQLGYAMQFYETLKSSGQRLSPRLIVVLIEACAREQHAEKVHAIWNDWCPPGQPIGANQSEVLLVAASALIRTMSPELAQEVLSDAIARTGDSLASSLPDAELEELLQLNDTMAEEARANGMLMGELAGRFSELHMLLERLRQHCLQELGSRPVPPLHHVHDDLLMEDVDVDLEDSPRLRKRGE